MEKQDKTSKWYARYYRNRGAESNDLLRNIEVLKRTSYYLYFNRKIKKPSPNRPDFLLPPGYKLECVRVTLYSIFSKSLKNRYKIMVLWILYFLRNKNREFRAVFIYAPDDIIVHQSYVLPRFFKYPFMNKEDGQIGLLWTVPEFRGRELATYALQHILLNSRDQVYWFIVEEKNKSSINVAIKNGFKLEFMGAKDKFGVYKVSRFNETKEKKQSETLPLGSCLKAGGAVTSWERTVREILPTLRQLIPAGSQVLEIGYGDGLLTCYLCQKLGWQIIGLDISKYAHSLAKSHAREFGLSEKIKFLCCEPEETRMHIGQYNAVFIKTVLYNSLNLDEYGKWLDWILSVLKPGGVLVNFETGVANILTQYYRRIRRRSYTDLCLYRGEIEALYESRFEIIKRRYYGGWSQFFDPIKPLYHFALKIEEAIKPRDADNCFTVSIIARKA